MDESDDPDLRAQARTLVNRRGSPPYRVCHAAIGEAFAGICLGRPDGLEVAVRHFDDYVNRRRRLEVYGIPRGASEDLHRLIIRLHDADPRLDPVDATILGTACVDGECTNLHTNDAILLQSISLREIAREYHTRIQGF